jgi:hypothetical protein
VKFPNLLNRHANARMRARHTINSLGRLDELESHLRHEKDRKLRSNALWGLRQETKFLLKASAQVTVYAVVECIRVRLVSLRAFLKK